MRVPTHENGTCVFWEFATDSYDLGFGVYFEWNISPPAQVSIQVSESSDEEDLDEDEAAAGAEGMLLNFWAARGHESLISNLSKDLPVYLPTCLLTYLSI